MSISILQRWLGCYAMSLPVPAIALGDMFPPEGNESFVDGQRVRWKPEVWENAHLMLDPKHDIHGAKYIRDVGRYFRVKKDYLGRINPDKNDFDHTIVDPNAIEPVPYNIL